ncbi:glutamate racemase [bacterium]|nr:MAG: glutamate racemase [bacterium]QQR62121.1 MAG: glutamate racemase [bacterium]
MSLKAKRPIGVFDSGVGGLTVLKALAAKMPYENFVYFADFMNLPYGNKTADQIKLLSDVAISHLINTYKVKAVVIACHTSSSSFCWTDQAMYPISIFSMVTPTVSMIKNANIDSIGILATEYTTRNKIYPDLLYQNGYNGRIVSIACPEFVPLIENNASHVEIDSAVRKYCLADVSAFLLGCTHFPIIEPVIKRVVGTKELLNPADAVAEHVYASLYQKGLISEQSAKGTIHYSTSGDQINLKKLAFFANCLGL